MQPSEPMSPLRYAARPLRVPPPAEPSRRERVVLSMPEGPSIVILREEVASFTGKTLLRATGNSKIDTQRLVNQHIVALRSWGKHFPIEFSGFAVRIHLLMFGTCRIRQFPNAPSLLLVSAEADLFPLHRPELADLIDGSIGEGSPFHEL